MKNQVPIQIELSHQIAIVTDHKPRDDIVI